VVHPLALIAAENADGPVARAVAPTSVAGAQLLAVLSVKVDAA
jgi:hypothetical protein